MVAGDAYYAVVDEFIKGVKNRWPNALVQFEVGPGAGGRRMVPAAS